MDLKKVADWVLRGGVAFAFLYPPINALYNPYSWIGYFPEFTRGFVPDMVMLHAFGVVEIIIALWILSGWKVQWPAVAATAILLAIVIFDFSQFEIVFRDLSIATAALYLVITNL
ncbi:MAG: hypothetical protein Q8R25_01445, partial [bacterium]|nr:hypothetical protein [bacterium]